MRYDSKRHPPSTGEGSLSTPSISHFGAATCSTTQLPTKFKESIIGIKYQVQRKLNKAVRESSVSDQEMAILTQTILADIQGVQKDSLRVTPITESPQPDDNSPVLGWSCQFQYASGQHSSKVTCLISNPSLEMELPRGLTDPFEHVSGEKFQGLAYSTFTKEEESFFFNAVLDAATSGPVLQARAIEQLMKVDPWYWVQTGGGAIGLESNRRFTSSESKHIARVLRDWPDKIVVPNDPIDEALHSGVKSASLYTMDNVLRQATSSKQSLEDLISNAAAVIENVIGTVSTNFPHWNTEKARHLHSQLIEFAHYLSGNLAVPITNTNPFTAPQLAHGMLSCVLDAVETRARATNAPFNRSSLIQRLQSTYITGPGAGQVPPYQEMLRSLFSDNGVRQICSNSALNREPVEVPTDTDTLNTAVELKIAVANLLKTINKSTTPEKLDRPGLQDQLCLVYCKLGALTELSIPNRAQVLHELDALLVTDYTQMPLNEYVLNRLQSIGTNLEHNLAKIPNRKKPHSASSDNNKTSSASTAEQYPSDNPLGIKYGVQKALYSASKTRSLSDIENIASISTLINGVQGVTSSTVVPIDEVPYCWEVKYTFTHEGKENRHAFKLIDPKAAKSPSFQFDNPFAEIPGHEIGGTSDSWPTNDQVDRFFSAIFNTAGLRGNLTELCAGEINQTDPWFWARIEGGRPKDFAAQKEFQERCDTYLIERCFGWAGLIELPHSIHEQTPLYKLALQSKSEMTQELESSKNLSDFLDRATSTIQSHLDYLKFTDSPWDYTKVETFAQQLRELTAYYKTDLSVPLTFDNPFIGKQLRNSVLLFVVDGINRHAKEFDIPFDLEGTAESLQSRLILGYQADDMPDMRELLRVIFNEPSVQRVCSILAEKRSPVAVPSDPERYNDLVDLKVASDQLGRTLRKVSGSASDSESKIAIQTQLFSVLTHLSKLPADEIPWLPETIQTIDEFLIRDLQSFPFDPYIIRRMRDINESISTSLRAIGTVRKATTTESASVASKPLQPVVIREEVPLTDPQRIEELVIGFSKHPYNRSALDIRRAQVVKEIEELSNCFPGSLEERDAQVGIIFANALRGYFERGDSRFSFGTGYKGNSQRLSDQQRINIISLQEAYQIREGTPLAAQKALEEQERSERHLAILDAKRAELQKLRDEQKALDAKAREEQFNRDFEALVEQEKKDRLAEEEAERQRAIQRKLEEEQRIRTAQDQLKDRLTDNLVQTGVASEIASQNPELALAIVSVSPEQINDGLRKIRRVFTPTPIEEVIKHEPDLVVSVIRGEIPDRALSSLSIHKEKIGKGGFPLNDTTDTPSFRAERASNILTTDIGRERVRQAFTSLPDDIKEIVRHACLELGNSFTVRFAKLREKSELINVVRYAQDILDMDSSMIVELLGKAPKLMDPPEEGEQSFEQFIEDDLKLAFDTVGLRQSSEIRAFLLGFPRVLSPHIIERADQLERFYRDEGVTITDLASALILHKEMILYGDSLTDRLNSLQAICEEQNLPFSRRDILIHYPSLLGFIGKESTERAKTILGLLVDASRGCDTQLTNGHIQIGSKLNPLVLKAAIERDPIKATPQAFKEILEDAARLTLAVRELHSSRKPWKIIPKVIADEQKETGISDEELVEYFTHIKLGEMNPTISEWLRDRRAREGSFVEKAEFYPEH